ncbi:ATP-binding protein [Massilia sp. S19_KUP03_FR1]|uniref:ATP-binding protein n=1 Tax=Massilia sp. S19_KUP03_FR1 TaxID=3025503 RepID=UPI002FCD9977
MCVAFVVFGATLAGWYSVESARVIAAENERLGALSKILVKDVAVNLVVVNNALAGVVRDRLGGASANDMAAVTQRLRALVEAMPGVRGLLVLDANGKVIAAVPDDLIGRNFAGRPYFTAPKQGGDATKLYLAPPFRSIRGDIVMSATRTIPGPGPFRGVVSAVLDPGYFSSILNTALYASDLRAAIVYHGGAAFVDVGARPLSPGAGEQLRADGAIVPASLRADSTIALTLRRDRALTLAPLNRQAQAFGAVAAMLVLVSAATLAWSQRRRRGLLAFEQEHKRELARAEAISASEARFRTLIEEAPVAVAMARRGRFIYTNRRYNLLHGYAPEDDLTSLPWRAMIAPSSLHALAEQQACLDVDGAAEQRFEAIALGKGNALIPVLKATTRVTLSDGPATLIFVQDITAQKTAESNLLEARDAAQAANRSKAEFLANMSHEIRTPLNAILGMAYLLERANHDAAAASMLQKIRIAGRSLLGIINDILDVSKIEAGAMVLERSWFPLQDVIDTVAATMGVAAGDKPIALLVQPLPPLAAMALGDALRLEQLLVNLTSNAIKFTDSGQVVLTVEAESLPDGHAELVFSVTDTGIGIAPDQQESIFSSFIQADSSTTRRYGGSGLGLTICKQIVSLMGGRIGVRSAPGAGSTFWFALTLPVRPAAASSSSPEMVDLAVLIAAAPGPGQAVLADTARALGWQVRSVAAGEEVLAEVLRPRRGSPVGVVVLDWQLGADGCLAAARALRADAAARGCGIVIVISTCQAAAFENHLARPLADALLTTPVTASTLYNAVIEAKRKRAANGAAPDVRPAGAQALAGVRLLVVDDSGINRDVAASILAEEGAEVVLAENGRIAVDWLVRHPHAVDLVLMDVQMPVMDGIEATRVLRGMAQFADLPIVALTAGAFSAHQDAARNAGMSHFVAKPFDIPLTIALIRRLAGVNEGAAAQPALPAHEQEQGRAVLDARLGLRIWGTHDKYQRYLRKFGAAYGDVVAHLRRDLASGDSAAVIALSHKLAGAAANVALPAVSALARRLESAMADPGAGAALLGELEVALGAALDALASFAPPMALEPVPGFTLAPGAALAPLLERMQAALEEGMPEPALAALADLAPLVPTALLAPIAVCIDDFDWPGAARHTAALASAHPTSFAS